MKISKLLQHYKGKNVIIKMKFNKGQEIFEIKLPKSVHRWYGRNWKR